MLCKCLILMLCKCCHKSDGILLKTLNIIVIIDNRSNLLARNDGAWRKAHFEGAYLGSLPPFFRNCFMCP